MTLPTTGPDITSALFCGSAIVVSNSAPAEVKLAVKRNKRFFSSFAQICGSANNDVEEQAAIDAVNTNGGGDVFLVGPSFTNNSQVNVKEGVTLRAEKNTAISPASGSSFTIFFVDRDASILGFPTIDVAGLSFTGIAVLLDTDLSAGFYNYEYHEKLELRGVGDRGSGGTFLRFHQNGASANIVGVDTELYVSGYSTQLELHGENANGWINGNRFKGWLDDGATNVYLRGTAGEIKSNRFYLELQQDTDSAYGFRCDSNPKIEDNQLIGAIWGDTNYTSAAVEYGANCGPNNSLNLSHSIAEASISNNSTHPTNGQIKWSNAYGLLEQMLRVGTRRDIPASGLAEASTGSASVTAETFRTRLTTGSDATDSTALIRTDEQPGLFIGKTPGVIAWSERLYNGVRLALPESTTNSIVRVGIGKSESDGVGDPTDKYAGFQIENGALKGIVRSETDANGGSLATVDLSTTVGASLVFLEWIIDGSANVEWFVDGVSVGTSSAGPQNDSTNTQACFQVEVDDGTDNAATSVDYCGGYILAA